MKHKPLTLWGEWTPNVCRFPLFGDKPVDGEQMFCGQPIAIRSYCEEHAALCLIVPSSRKGPTTSWNWAAKPREDDE